MIDMAAKRNADHVSAGTAVFQTASLHEAQFGGARFDQVFAIHVAALVRGQPERELGIVRELLAGDGRLCSRSRRRRPSRPPSQPRRCAYAPPCPRQRSLTAVM
jgi:hypothetical protein